MRSNLRLVFGIAVSCWLTWLLWFTRHAMIDDSLIHLRYAAYLHDLGFITYDGTTHSFGTSSLLWVSLLALLRSFTTSPLLPKALSVLFYLVLLATVFRFALRMRKASFGRFALYGLFAALLVPMAVRWLTDGMETGLTLVAAIWLAWLLRTQRDPAKVDALSYLGSALFGFALVALRIELASLAVMASVAAFLLRLRNSHLKPGARELLRSALEASHFAVGAIAALGVIFCIFGSVLPDTAVAKSAGEISLFPLVSMAQVMASSMVLGVCTFLIWVTSALVRLSRILRASDHLADLGYWAVTNAPLPMIAVLACLRGQLIQGVRYVLWAMVFSIVANAFDSDEPGNTAQVHAFARIYAVLLIALFPFDVHYGLRVMHGRAITFDQMRAADLSRTLKGKTILAADVGFISYFSQGNTCDIDGLVNGIRIARMSVQERKQWCASRYPEAMFVTVSQLGAEAPYLDMDRWDACRSFDFPDVRSNDRHYLLVRREVARTECQQMAGTDGFPARALVAPGVRSSEQ